MKVAIIGSRGLSVDDLGKYLPTETTEIVSGGAIGVDHSARKYALQSGIPLKEYLPDYEAYGSAAPLQRNISIIERADLVLAFWDGRSRGTAYVIRKCHEMKVPCRVFMKKSNPSPNSA